MAQKPGTMISVYGAGGVVHVPRIQTSRIMSKPDGKDCIGRDVRIALGVLMSVIIVATGLILLITGVALGITGEEKR